MIVVTGSAGFIGSCLVNKLNNKGLADICIVDDFSSEIKNKNILRKAYKEKIHRNEFMEWLTNNHENVKFVFHLGARTDTTEFDTRIFDELNLNYSKNVWNACVQYNIPLVYASSAATYGDGKLGYADNHQLITKLQPLNPYGISKNEFDKWVLQQSKTPPFWAGLKFFNVYGPNEYHKGRMASVIFHAYRQIQEKGFVNLFKSHHPDFVDGKQLRDFVYVKDVTAICYFLYLHQKNSGIFNIGTGKARTFEVLVNSVFNALGKKSDIRYIDMPLDIRDKYQYYTEADISKLRNIGYSTNFYSLEEGVTDYVQTYLSTNNYY